VICHCCSPYIFVIVVFPTFQATRISGWAVSMYAAGNLNDAGLPCVRSAARVHVFALPTSSAISTMSDTNSPPATDFVQPVSQSRVLAGRSRSIVIPPRMFGQARGRGSSADALRHGGITCHTPKGGVT
jgi:hypothetical protein